MKNKFYLVVIAVVVVGAGLCVQFASAQKTNAVPTWDYKLISVEESRVSNDFWWKEDGIDLPGPVRVLTKATQLGAQGWELVSVSGGGVYTNYWYKRAK